jgi:hypothetical protein
MNHPPYSPDLAPRDLQFFGPMKVHLGEQKFQTDELKLGILNWPWSQDETLSATDNRNLLGWWKKYLE